MYTVSCKAPRISLLYGCGAIIINKRIITVGIIISSPGWCRTPCVARVAVQSFIYGGSDRQPRDCHTASCPRSRHRPNHRGEYTPRPTRHRRRKPSTESNHWDESCRYYDLYWLILKNFCSKQLLRCYCLYDYTFYLVWFIMHVNLS